MINCEQVLDWIIMQITGPDIQWHFRNMGTVVLSQYMPLGWESVQESLASGNTKYEKLSLVCIDSYYGTIPMELGQLC